MKKAITILKKTKITWQLVRSFEALLYGLGVGLFLFSFTRLEIALGTSIVAIVVFFLLLKPWKISMQHVASLYDAKYPEVQDSTSLLLQPTEDLSMLAKFQQKKVANLFKSHKPTFPPHHLTRASVFLVVMMLLGFGVNKVLPDPEIEGLKTQPVLTERQIKDTAAVELPPPAISEYEVRIIPPTYTKIPISRGDELSIRAIENSKVTWTLIPNENVEAVFLETSGKATQQLSQVDGAFQISATLRENGFYNFRLVGQDSSEHITDLYNISVVKDEPPQLEVASIDQYTTFEYNQQKKATFKTVMSDDFGLTDAYIIATVSKGTGEAVKFREEKLQFNQTISSKSLSIQKTLDLDQLKMSPGDELYFYVEAWDNKVPQRQKTRTETYFMNIRDTTEMEFSLAGNLGVDLMPEYFRSQRQIIIDTEKLIADKSQLPKKEFNSKSNELGYDQKQLRLKYGQFMGVEDESGIAIETEMPAEEAQESDDPLAEYSHDHDGDNEHNLIAEENDHEHEGGHEGEEDPLEAYIHDHDNPEEATLYIESTRSMLKQAMAEMWDAELYLRLYQPEKSLPYQYKALEWIKKIKNHARIYVHRIGFDPPPIKEDKRLTGDLDEVDSKTINENRREQDLYAEFRNAIDLINRLLQTDDILLKASHRQVFENAGNTLAPFAIEQPAKYLKTLERLKWLSNNEVEIQEQKAVLKSIGAVLNEALPGSYGTLANTTQEGDTLTNSFLKHLNALDND